MSTKTAPVPTTSEFTRQIGFLEQQNMELSRDVTSLKKLLENEKTHRKVVERYLHLVITETTDAAKAWKEERDQLEDKVARLENDLLKWRISNRGADGNVVA